MQRERDKNIAQNSGGSNLLKGILIGVGIGAAIGSAILGYSIYKELTKEEVDKIPVSLLKQSEADKKNECAICLDHLKLNDSVKVIRNCRHTYHASCINEWILRNPSCPLCRRQCK